MKTLNMPEKVCVCIIVSCLSLLSGCSTVPEYYTSIHRTKLYISQSPQTTKVTVPYGVESTGGGAAKGAGKGFAGCIAGGAQTGEPLGLIFGVIISPVCAVVGGVYGAATADKEKAAKSKGMNLLEWIDGSQLQNRFNQYLTEYAAKEGINYVNLAAQSAKTQYDDTSDGGKQERKKFMLEVGISDITLERITKGKKPEQDKLCLVIGISGEVYRDHVQRPVSISSRLACKTQQAWRQAGIQDMSNMLDSFLKGVAADLLDDTYLIYYPNTDQHSHALTARHETLAKYFPPYVLAPLQPAMHFPGETDNPAAGQPGLQFSTGLAIPVTDSLQPTLRWEAFPMPWDANLQQPGVELQAIRYELKLYDGNYIGKAGFLTAGYYVRGKLLDEKRNLLDTSYRIERRLLPCHTYFWTVRARFRVNGANRVTEWGGAYKDGVYPWYERMHSSRLSPHGANASRYYYYMFKTPASLNGQCSDSQ